MPELEDFERVDVAVGEMTFAAIAAGPTDGRLVLLLHGFPQTSWEWRAQLPALAEAGCRAVAFDQRGYSPGARPASVDAYAMDHLVADVLAVADEMGGHQFDLVGHDWGGMVAWNVAARYPDRLRTLTVASTPHPAAMNAARSAGGEQAAKSSYFDFFRQEGGVAEDAFLANAATALRGLFSGLDPDVVEQYLSVVGEREALTAALNWYRAMPGEGFVEPGEVTVPTMYVWSSADPVLAADAAEGTAKWVTGPYRFETLQGVSHWIPDEAPDQLNALLLEHLQAHS